MCMCVCVCVCVWGGGGGGDDINQLSLVMVYCTYVHTGRVTVYCKPVKVSTNWGFRKAT